MMQETMWRNADKSRKGTEVIPQGRAALRCEAGQLLQSKEEGRLTPFADRQVHLAFVFQLPKLLVDVREDEKKN